MRPECYRIPRLALQYLRSVLSIVSPNRHLYCYGKRDRSDFRKRKKKGQSAPALIGEASQPHNDVE
jgi:hypothetical protein